MGLSRCPKCDSTVSNDDKFCRHCGCKLEKEPIIQVIDSFDNDNSIVKEESVNEETQTTKSTSSNRYLSKENEFETPYDYPKEKVDKTIIRCIIDFVLSVGFGIGGGYLLYQAINNSGNNGDNDTLYIVLGSILACFALSFFIYGIAKLIGSRDTSRVIDSSHSEAEDVADAVLDILEIGNDVIDIFKK